MTDPVRSLQPTSLAWVVAVFLLALCGAGCAGNEPSKPLPEDKGVDESPVVATRPTGGAGSASVPVLSLRDEAAFAAYVQEQLNRGQFGALREVMSKPFVLQLHPTGIFAEGIDDSLFALQFRLVADRDVAIRIGGVDASQLMAQGIDPMALYRGSQPVTRVLASSGWGLAASGVGLLYLTEEESDEWRWAGLVLTHQGEERTPFTPLPQPDTTTPPAGLIYTVGDVWWKNENKGPDRLLARYEGRLSLNPAATLAIAAEIEAQSVTLFDFTKGISQTLSLEDTLILGARDAPWLDEHTVVLGIAVGAGAVTQSTTGTLALLDVRNGALTPLGPEISTYAHPAATGGALVVDSSESVWLWQRGSSRFLELDDMQALESQGNLFSPVLAPGGNMLAGVITGNFGRHTHGYASVDLGAGAAHLAHTFQPVPTEARPDWRIRWSANGVWLALEPPSWDPLESGVWLVRSDGTDRRGLGPGTESAVWLDGERLAYTRIVDGTSRVERLDMGTGETVWLDLPSGARPVAFVIEE